MVDPNSKNDRKLQELMKVRFDFTVLVFFDIIHIMRRARQWSSAYCLINTIKTYARWFVTQKHLSKSSMKTVWKKEGTFKK